MQRAWTYLVALPYSAKCLLGGILLVSLLALVGLVVLSRWCRREREDLRQSEDNGVRRRS